MQTRLVGLLSLSLVIGSLASSAQVEAAYGFCRQPMAPSTFIMRPTKPYCARDRSCSDWQVKSYRNEVESYYDSLKRYAGQVDEYYTDAGAYIKCMAELD